MGESRDRDAAAFPPGVVGSRPVHARQRAPGADRGSGRSCAVGPTSMRSGRRWARATTPITTPLRNGLRSTRRISRDRLQARNRILDALPTDIGILVSALADAGEPLDWGSTLLAARVGQLRTAMLAELTNRSMPAARAELGRMARANSLEPRGITRGRWYAPAERLDNCHFMSPS